ncbi:MAG: hypothetical protein WC003_05955, partial [Terrimicrobiaceae bacterium]
SPLHQIKPLRYCLQVAGAIFHIGTIAETPCCIKLFLDDSLARIVRAVPLRGPDDRSTAAAARLWTSLHSGHEQWQEWHPDWVRINQAMQR